MAFYEAHEDGTPKTLKIGAHTYEIEVEPRIERDYTRFWGRLEYAKNKLQLDSELVGIRKYETLWHGCFHGILSNGGFRKHDEQMVDVLAAGVVQLLQDNPWMRDGGGSI